MANMKEFVNPLKRIANAAYETGIMVCLETILIRDELITLKIIEAAKESLQKNAVIKLDID